MQVWKFPLQLYGSTTVEVPKGAKPLSVTLDLDNNPMLYCLVDSDNCDREYLNIFAVETGASLKFTHNVKFLGTLSVPDNSWSGTEENKCLYVVHYFMK